MPFRLRHRFAFDLVTWGRAHNATPATIPYTEAQVMYTQAAKETGQESTTLPLSEDRFHAVLGARNMGDSAKGVGGSQPAELARMLTEAQDSLATDQAWLTARRAALQQADVKLDAAFNALLPSP